MAADQVYTRLYVSTVSAVSTDFSLKFEITVSWNGPRWAIAYIYGVMLLSCKWIRQQSNWEKELDGRMFYQVKSFNITIDSAVVNLCLFLLQQTRLSG